MDHWLKYKIHNYKTPRVKHRRKPRYGNDILNTNVQLKIIDELKLIKIKNFSSTKENDKRIRRQPQNGRKHLQKTLLIKDC